MCVYAEKRYYIKYRIFHHQIIFCQVLHSASFWLRLLIIFSFIHCNENVLHPKINLNCLTLKTRRKVGKKLQKKKKKLIIKNNKQKKTSIGNKETIFRKKKNKKDKSCTSHRSQTLSNMKRIR